MGSCANDFCYADKGEQCALGEMSKTECSCWNASTDKQGENTPNTLEPDAARVPWSSSALGSVDVARLYQQGPTILVGLLGAENSGKTTFLASIYLQLLAGSELNEHVFCGSQTLGAWESIAAYCRLDSTGYPSFPPHTPRSIERTPGILHFNMGDCRGVTKNLLFTDSPGEWFNHWALEPNSSDAQGAKWTVKHSDIFLIFADCEKLSGPQRGAARKELRAIISRLAETVSNRPVIFVWAKSDKPAKESIRQTIQASLEESIPHAVEVEVSVDKPQSMLLATEGMLKLSWVKATPQSIIEPIINNNAFLSFRGHHEFS